MKLAELFTLLISTIEAGLVAQQLTLADEEGEGGVVVQQSNQPTQQGVPSAPTVAIYYIGSRRVGYPKRSDKWVPPVGAEPGYMAHEERQWHETTFQVTALVTQNVKLLNQLAADDLATAAANALQSDAGLALLKAQQVGILRITATRPGLFVDDRGRNEYAPNFDFTVTHENVRLSQNPAVSGYEFNLKRV